jgi:hypothetical protein
MMAEPGNHEALFSQRDHLPIRIDLDPAALVPDPAPTDSKTAAAGREPR